MSPSQPVLVVVWAPSSMAGEFGVCVGIGESTVGGRGVCGSLIPSRRGPLAPALAAGNTVPGKATWADRAHQCADCRLRPGALRCLPALSTCSPSRATPARRSSSNPPMSTWSASPAVLRSAGRSPQLVPTLKRMNLELGGETPMIVFDNAPLASTPNTGRRCYDLCWPELHGGLSHPRSARHR